jgi:Holliday junction DNA helicase RuvA
MIASLQGTVSSKEDDSIVVNIGHVGIHVYVPVSMFNSLSQGDVVSLYTHLVVREDSLTLFGFESREEKEIYILMLGVSGIGPKLALAAISTLSPEAIRRAVFQEQAEVFSRIPGVGKKTAQKVLLHLQDKVGAMDDLSMVASMTDVDTDVLEALTALGYSVVEAQAAIQSIPKDSPTDTEARLLIALQYFS